MSVTIKLRNATSTQWASSTRILAKGEFAVDTTLNKFKIGDGTKTFAQLDFVNVLPSELSELSQDAINSAITVSNGLTKNYNDAGNAIELSIDQTTIATVSALSAHESDTTNIHGITNTADLATKTYADSAVSTHSSDTTDIHGISNTADLATKSYVDNAVSGLVDSAPATLNTLNELAAALGDDANYATTISTALGSKLDSTTASSTYAPINSPTFTGTVSGITSTMVGLGNVDNTSDANKPVSSATQTALNAKLDSSNFTYAGITIPVYTATTDLPAAADNHGRWAHVHGEGAMYFAHGGAWYRALSQTDLYASTNAQSGSYTIDTTDIGKMIEMSGGGTLTISDSASFPNGFTVNVLQTGSSQVTIAGSGFTPNATPGLKLRAQWSSATIVKRSLNSWVVMGDLSA